MSTPELLPCPFCGEEVDFILADEPDENDDCEQVETALYLINCKNCDAFSDVDDKANLAQWWNNRVDYTEALHTAILEWSDEIGLHPLTNDMIDPLITRLNDVLNNHCRQKVASGEGSDS